MQEQNRKLVQKNGTKVAKKRHKIFRMSRCVKSDFISTIIVPTHNPPKEKENNPP